MLNTRKSLASHGAICPKRPSRPSSVVSRMSSDAPSSAAQAVNAICVKVSIGHDAFWLLPTLPASRFADTCTLSLLWGASHLGNGRKSRGNLLGGAVS